MHEASLPQADSKPDRSETAPRLDPATLDGAREIATIAAAAGLLGIADPFFRVHDGIAGAETVIEGRRYVNFASYDYLARAPGYCADGDAPDGQDQK